MPRNRKPAHSRQPRRRRHRLTYLYLGIAVIVVGLAVAASVVRRPSSPAPTTAADAGGQPTAAAAAPTPGIVGPVDSLNLAEAYPGKILVLNYMASWCTACQIEIPGLVQVYDRYRNQGVQLIGISLQTSRADTQTMIDRLGIDYPVYLDTSGAAALKRFHLLGMPTTLIFKDGQLLKRFDGEIRSTTLISYLTTLVD